ncbi:amino acid ABC transporter substrate-binding protein [Pelomicrobium methylotrophicum]|uniref:Amino acid ABC transporter substrate-binding protein n=1 Tax=Pelomicrobium methylotrophicum TaxID=2602750 RepID=A0A5C7END9_9PROT|nr:amino acid ABC transporter substrate-binding protein [Pelomicrobium methylotrophicum]TXF12834.1 amino acid ABC transporter substrate-binding protein [Pelomicrobium methylotrophicum]
MKLIHRIVVAAAAVAFTAAPALAAELAGTLKKIRDTGTIVIGHREASIPFSYLDDQQKPIGYSMDICARIVEEVKKELKMPNLQVKYNPVTSQTRIPLMANGTIDLECGSTTNTTERQKQVAFAVTTFITGTKLLVKKDSGIKSVDDLKGKTVVVTQGTTNERAVKQINDEKKLGIRFLHAKDHAESFLTVETGRAVAFPMDHILLYGLIANSKNPAEWDVVGEFLSFDPYAIMLRKDDPQWKQFVDGVIVGMMKSGELEKLYTKWFLSPIPPKNAILNVPMTPQLVEQFRNPNDKGA